MNKQKLKEMFEREGYKEISEDDYYKTNKLDGYEVSVKTMNEILYFAPKRKQKYESGNLEAVWNEEEKVWEIIGPYRTYKGFISKTGNLVIKIYVKADDVLNIFNQMKKDGVFEND